MTQRPFVVDPTLTAVVIGYKNEDLIGDLVLPRIKVRKSKFAYHRLPKGQNFTVPETEIGRRSQPNVVEFNQERVTDETKTHGLSSPIPDEDDADAEEQEGVADPADSAALGLKALIDTAREIRVAAVVQNSANYGSSETLVGNAQFSAYSTSKPIEKIQGIIAGPMRRPNRLVMGAPVWDWLRGHPDIVSACLGNDGTKGLATREQVARLFEVKHVLVGAAYKNTAKPGLAENMARVWGKDLAAIYIPDEHDPLAPNSLTWGFTAVLGTPGARRFRDEKMGGDGGEWVVVRERLKELACAPDCGAILKAAVA